MRARYDIEYEHLADPRFIRTLSSDSGSPRCVFPVLGSGIFMVRILASMDAFCAGVLYVAHQLGAPRDKNPKGNFQIAARYGDSAQCAVPNKHRELV